jgi:hypothetical protein
LDGRAGDHQKKSTVVSTRLLDLKKIQTKKANTTVQQSQVVVANSVSRKLLPVRNDKPRNGGAM